VVLTEGPDWGWRAVVVHSERANVKVLHCFVEHYELQRQKASSVTWAR
jgi:hypothetical protein